MAELNTKAEIKAQEATALTSFNHINLGGIKDSLEKMLAQIGHDGIFDEYTKHDITHVNTMLEMLDFLIPMNTQNLMTSADWLLIVLSFYFHDLGMLVTKKEFSSRLSNERYKQYRFDYLSKKANEESLKIYNGEDEKERFIYQEYVRLNHGNRIADWLRNENTEIYDNEVCELVQNMVSGLKPIFIRDLAIICRSHNEDILDNPDQFEVKSEYGMNLQEKGNVFYAALILRTADLLHITENRCPSEQFQLISPNNPTSQIEWAKQSKVNSISPKDMTDKEGNANKEVQSDTLCVTGYFDDPKGFFPLMDYLEYARQQLKKSYKLNEEVKRKKSTEYDFPWKDIDDSKVDTNEYERQQLSFTIDQQKILDLLVGETLYNNITVSLREISQNAIDAVKLKKYEEDERGNNNYKPKVEVSWIPETRQLIISDNGTGMDMDTINNHLLRVGSSRYQDKEFIKTHSRFNSISRFGIGLLSCFLVAEDVDILTSSDITTKPLLLKVSKLHGKYLLKHGLESGSPLKLLDNNSTGTSIMLRILPGINFDPEEILHDWILFPQCDFLFKQGEKREIIGFSNTKEMVRSVIQSRGIWDDDNYKIIGQNEEGLDMSILMKKDKYLKDWSFVDYSEIFRNDETNVVPCGLSVEGIRIDSNTPGFKTCYILAIVNLTGKNAPQTNVARSAINSQTSDKALLRIYETYLKEINSQIQDIGKEYSLTWASSELPYMLDKFSRDDLDDGRDRLSSKNLFSQALLGQRFFLIEEEGKRNFYSIDQLKEKGHFWVIDSAAYNSANNLIREVKSSDLSVIKLLSNLYGTHNKVLDDIDVLLSRSRDVSNLDELMRNSFEVSIIRLFEEHRCLNLLWRKKEPNSSSWICIDNRQMHRRYNYRYSSSFSFYIQQGEIEIISSSNLQYEAIRSDYGLFILKGSSVHTYLTELYDRINGKDELNNYAIQVVCLFINTHYGKTHTDFDWNRSFEDYLSKNYSQSFVQKYRKIINVPKLIEACSNSCFSLYDKYLWYRERQNSEIYLDY